MVNMVQRRRQEQGGRLNACDFGSEGSRASMSRTGSASSRTNESISPRRCISPRKTPTSLNPPRTEAPQFHLSMPFSLPASRNSSKSSAQSGSSSKWQLDSNLSASMPPTTCSRSQSNSHCSIAATAATTASDVFSLALAPPPPMLSLSASTSAVPSTASPLPSTPSSPSTATATLPKSTLAMTAPSHLLIMAGEESEGETANRFSHKSEAPNAREDEAEDEEELPEELPQQQQQQLEEEEEEEEDVRLEDLQLLEKKFQPQQTGPGLKRRRLEVENSFQHEEDEAPPLMPQPRPRWKIIRQKVALPSVICSVFLVSQVMLWQLACELNLLGGGASTA